MITEDDPSTLPKLAIPTFPHSQHSPKSVIPANQPMLPTRTSPPPLPPASVTASPPYTLASPTTPHTLPSPHTVISILPTVPTSETVHPIVVEDVPIFEES